MFSFSSASWILKSRLVDVRQSDYKIDKESPPVCKMARRTKMKVKSVKLVKEEVKEAERVKETERAVGRRYWAWRKKQATSLKKANPTNKRMNKQANEPTNKPASESDKEPLKRQGATESGRSR